MKKISIALAAIAMISFVSCTNNETTGEETPTADTTIVEPTPVVADTNTMVAPVEGVIEGAADAATGAVKDAANGAVDAAAEAAKKAVK